MTKPQRFQDLFLTLLAEKWWNLHERGHMDSENINDYMQNAALESYESLRAEERKEWNTRRKGGEIAQLSEEVLGIGCGCGIKYCKHYESDFDRFVLQTPKKEEPRKLDGKIEIGEFTIWKMRNGSIWIENSKGEGMEAPNDLLGENLHDFFKTNF